MAYTPNGTFDAGIAANGGDGVTGAKATKTVTYVAHERVDLYTNHSSANGAATETISDGTNLYTLRGGVATSPGGDLMRHYECLDTAAGTFTITQTLSIAQPFRGFHGVRSLGLTGAGVVVSNPQTAPGLTTDAVTSTSVTPASSQKGVLFGHTYDANGFAPTQGTGFTSLGNFPTEGAANGSEALAEYKYPITSTTPIPATFTANASDGGGAYTTFGVWVQEAVSGPSLMGRSIYVNA